MNRSIATLPDAAAELCLIRLGLQVRQLSALRYAARIGRAIERPAAEAIRAGAGLLHSEPFSMGRRHFGVLQYWRSFDDLDVWSHRAPHLNWRREAVDRMRTRGDFGIYHEIFLVSRDRLE